MCEHGLSTGAEVSLPEICNPASKDYLSGAPPSVGAERAENFENRDLSDSRKWQFPRLESRV